MLTYKMPPGGAKVTYRAPLPSPPPHTSHAPCLSSLRRMAVLGARPSRPRTTSLVLACARVKSIMAQTTGQHVNTNSRQLIATLVWKCRDGCRCLGLHHIKGFWPAHVSEGIMAQATRCLNSSRGVKIPAHKLYVPYCHVLHMPFFHVALVQTCSHKPRLTISLVDSCQNHRAYLCARLQPFPHNDEGDDEGTGLKVHTALCVGGQGGGQHHCQDGVAIGGGCTENDQKGHVGAAVAKT